MSSFAASQQPDLRLTCEYCAQAFNRDERRPLKMPCLHTLCAQCTARLRIAGMMASTIFICPYCNARHSIRAAVDYDEDDAPFPVSYAVLSLLLAAEAEAPVQLKVVRLDIGRHFTVTVRAGDTVQALFDRIREQTGGIGGDGGEFWLLHGKDVLRLPDDGDRSLVQCNFRHPNDVVQVCVRQGG